MAKRPSTRPLRARRSTPASAAVQLVLPTGPPIAVTWPAAHSAELATLQKRVMEWTHVVRNRARWIRSKPMAEQQDANAREFLAFLGVTDAERKQIAEAGTVRVSIPYADEERGWEARILPWEFILPAATRDLRSDSLVVTRALVQTQATTGSPVFKRVLFVESAPGKLENEWEFEDERRLVESYTRPAKFKRLISPTRGELRQAVTDFNPDIVHLAGFDSHQGLALLDDKRAEAAFDGYLLRGERGVDPVPAMELAGALVPSTHVPSLVFCNLWNSAARIAPLLVAAGARASIGFQDGLDDSVAEIFLGNFYRVLSATSDLDAAFQQAWQTMAGQTKPLRGSGIALWRSERHGTATTAVKRTSTAVREEKVLRPESLSADEARDQLSVTAEPEPQFSYGLLHNGRDLFKRFLVRNLSHHRIAGLEVHVELHSNEGSYPYRQSFSVDQTGLDLQPKVRIPLTSNLARTVDEMLRTTLYVHIKWGPHDIFRESYPVTMAPVDQWTDTDADRIFLPSFMFPRDRAVNKIIRNAEQFMTALRDEPSAGFDGYQNATRADASPVDAQVQALWYSIVYHVPASYINPPPTYAVASQRIRTPSEIVEGGFGTCIDLALMLASCLEAIEIHPVIFVLNDHAFPGYWRSEAARTAFIRNIASSASNPGTTATGVRGNGGSAKRRPGAEWCYDAASLGDIKKAVRNNQLVPLESVGLSERSSLAEAIETAKGYLLDKEEEDRFLLMLDVKTARIANVTPLPLGQRLR